MTTREREVTAYMLGVIKGALEPDAGTTQREQGQAAVRLLLSILDGSHGAASHATRGRTRKARETSDEVSS